MYIGQTKDLKRRIYQHKTKAHPTTFSAKYNLKRLVYYEVHKSEVEARLREKRMKKWNRSWKIELIEKSNPDWKDLFNNL